MPLTTPTNAPPGFPFPSPTLTWANCLQVLVLCPGEGRKGLALHPAGKVIRVPSMALPVWSEYRLTWGLGRDARRALNEFSPTVVHVAVPDAMGWAALKWATARSVATLCSHHTRWTAYLDYYPALPTAPLRRLAWWHLVRFHRRCGATLPPSEAVKKELVEHGVPRVHVWPRGVDTTLFSPRHRARRRELAFWAPQVEAEKTSIRREPAAPLAHGGRVGSAAESEGAPPLQSRRAGEARTASCSQVLPDGTNAQFSSSSQMLRWHREVYDEELPIVLLVARLRWEKGLKEFAAVIQAAQVALSSSDKAHNDMAFTGSLASTANSVTGAAAASSRESSSCVQSDARAMDADIAGVSPFGRPSVGHDLPSRAAISSCPRQLADRDKSNAFSSLTSPPFRTMIVGEGPAREGLEEMLPQVRCRELERSPSTLQ